MEILYMIMTLLAVAFGFFLGRYDGKIRLPQLPSFGGKVEEDKIEEEEIRW